MNKDDTTTADNRSAANRESSAQDLLSALQEVVRVLENNPPSICDTVWVTGGRPETLLDHCLAAIHKAEARKATLTGSPVEYHESPTGVCMSNPTDLIQRLRFIRQYAGIHIAPDDQAAMEDAASQLESQQARIRTLTEALKQYGRHKGRCDLLNPENARMRCSCGFDTALSQE